MTFTRDYMEASVEDQVQAVIVRVVRDAILTRDLDNIPVWLTSNAGGFSVKSRVVTTVNNGKPTVVEKLEVRIGLTEYKDVDLNDYIVKKYEDPIMLMKRDEFRSKYVAVYPVH